MQRFLCYCFVAVVAGSKIGICSVYVWLQRHRLYLVIWSWLKGSKPNACLCFSFDHNIQVPTLSSCGGQVLTVVVHHSWINVEERLKNQSLSLVKEHTEVFGVPMQARGRSSERRRGETESQEWEKDSLCTGLAEETQFPMITFVTMQLGSYY